MAPDQAIVFVQAHGVVMESASGLLPSLVRAIVGEDVHGSWWAHTEGKRIFQITRAVRASPEVLACRLIGGRITLVHERVWYKGAGVVLTVLLALARLDASARNEITPCQVF